MQRRRKRAVRAGGFRSQGTEATIRGPGSKVWYRNSEKALVSEKRKPQSPRCPKVLVPHESGPIKANEGGKGDVLWTVGGHLCTRTRDNCRERERERGREEGREKEREWGNIPKPINKQSKVKKQKKEASLTLAVGAAARHEAGHAGAVARVLVADPLPPAFEVLLGALLVPAHLHETGPWEGEGGRGGHHCCWARTLGFFQKAAALKINLPRPN